MVGGAATTTILFTDLVGSTDLMESAGDERAQRIFQAHYRLLRDAVAANGGQEVKTLGDGLMVAFASAADAVRAAIAMQQSSSRRAQGEKLRIRVGLNTGEALRDEGDYFGVSVVVARRLCDRAEVGQILCSSIVAALLETRQSFAFKDLGLLELKGISQPVAAYEVLYEANDPTILLTNTPFIGREAEMARVEELLAAARSGRGGLVMIVGEPGIGKTRLASEVCEQAREKGSTILWGRSFEGDYQPPFAPFSQAISEYARSAVPEELKADLGPGAGPIARVAPDLRLALPDIPEPERLEPEEERFRLLDGVSQFLIALSRRAPVVLVLDDLHWAEKGTIALMRHVARFAAANRILLLGTYRDVELDRHHPLADALSAMRREVEYQRILLKGLDEESVGRLLEAIAEQDINPNLIAAISAETDGNPFFIREVLSHLVEEGKLYHDGERWQSDAGSIAELGIPEGIRQVVGRRLSRLSADANQLLQAASAFNGVFNLGVAARACGLDEMKALDALDEALEAQIVRPTPVADFYDFTHALLRHTLYGEMSPSRQVRLHRQVAEAMEAAFGQRASAHAAEIAYQFHRSLAIPGAERGVDYALQAAARAESAYAYDERASHLRMALDMLPEEDERRTDLLADFGIALAYAVQADEGLKVTLEAAERLAARDGDARAAEYLAKAAFSFGANSLPRVAWELGRVGVPLKGEVRDGVWLRLKAYDIDRINSLDPNTVGIEVDSEERREIMEVARSLPVHERGTFLLIPRNREEALKIVREGGTYSFMVLPFAAGLPREGADAFEKAAIDREARGLISEALAHWSQVARCRLALGEIEAARVALARAAALEGRVAGPSRFAIQLLGAYDELALVTGEGIEFIMGVVEQTLAEAAPENAWVRVAGFALVARARAMLGRKAEALSALEATLAGVRLASGGDSNYARIIGDDIMALWWLADTTHIEELEANLEKKILLPDLRYLHQESRLSMARIAALTGRFAQARDWFAKSRAVLDEQGARPLRAVLDFDEAWMYLRWPAAGGANKAAPLLQAARAEFEAIGMTGWVRWADELAAGQLNPGTSEP